MSRLDAVYARRAALIERADEDRMAIATSVVALERPMMVAGRVLGVVNFVRANPLVIVGALALLMLLPRRRRRAAVVPARREGAMVWAKRLALLDIIRRGFFLWRSARRILKVSAFVARVMR
jgi:hypothetical protein